MDGKDAQTMEGRQLRRLLVRKSHDQACAIPQFDILAANKVPRYLDGVFIMGAFDDFRWPRNLVGLVDKIDAIFGRGGPLQVGPRSSPTRSSPTKSSPTKPFPM